MHHFLWCMHISNAISITETVCLTVFCSHGRCYCLVDSVHEITILMALRRLLIDNGIVFQESNESSIVVSGKVGPLSAAS